MSLIPKRTTHIVNVFQQRLSETVNLDMVRIPGGSFLMGSPEDEPERRANESPQHLVTVPSFCIGRYPVTQAQYQAVTGENPAHFKGDPRLPVECVSWNDAIAFCRQLSQLAGRKYRLPSEAEWEYACRAGTTTPFHCGETISTVLANYDGTLSYGRGKTGLYRQKTTPVGSFPPNDFGLYDMHGNVWEWCLDSWHDNYEGAPIDRSAWLSEDESSSRLRRGGSWDEDPDNSRSANRSYYSPVNRVYDLGFRILFGQHERRIDSDQ